MIKRKGYLVFIVLILLLYVNGCTSNQDDEYFDYEGLYSARNENVDRDIKDKATIPSEIHEHNQNCNHNQDHKEVNQTTNMTWETMSEFKGIQSEIETPSIGNEGINIKDYKSGGVVVHDDIFTYNILVEDNYVYYLYMKDEKTVIESLKISDFIRENKTIHMASSLQSLATPFGCGYEIMREFPDEESFALSVLAKDKEYDLFILDSRQEFSMNLKKNSSFYPLNELKYVNEYLEACFPYVKESAMTEDGAIWMLPIDINIPTIIYDKGNCVEVGFGLETDMSVLEFEAYINERVDQEDDGFVYDFFPYIVQTNFFADYLRGKTDLEDDVFRQGAEIIKQLHIASDKMDRVKSWQRISNMFNSGELDQLLFTHEYYFESQERMLLHGNLSVMPTPTMNQHTDYVATTVMLCVNPYSNNLKATLNYINALCKYLLENNDGMILEGKDRYSEELWELYDIYAKGDVQFTMPNEIFHQEFDKYVNDLISLDELISTVNRKIDTYLKE